MSEPRVVYRPGGWVSADAVQEKPDLSVIVDRLDKIQFALDQILKRNSIESVSLCRAAKLMKCGRSKVTALINSGKLRAYHEGKKIKIRLDDIRSFQDENTINEEQIC